MSAPARDEKMEVKAAARAGGRTGEEESRSSRVAGERRRISWAAPSWIFSETEGEVRRSRVLIARGVRERRRREAAVREEAVAAERSGEERSREASAASEARRARREGGRASDIGRGYDG